MCVNDALLNMGKVVFGRKITSTKVLQITESSNYSFNRFHPEATKKGIRKMHFLSVHPDLYIGMYHLQSCGVIAFL